MRRFTGRSRCARGSARRSSTPAWIVLSIALSACGEPPATPDSGPDGGPDIAPPEAPAVATLASLTPCPRGWVARQPAGQDSVATCDPFPSGGPLECAADEEAHFAGETACRAIGTPCPEGDWADVPDDDGPVLYVLADAPAGGDGTEASPFGSIAEAMDSALAGTTIALSEGVFDEEVELRTGVTLWGACVAGTTLTTSIPDDLFGTVEVRGADTALKNLRIGGARGGVRAMGAVTSVDLEAVLVQGAVGYGIFAEVGHVTGRDVIVRETESLESSGERGFGIWADRGGRVELSRVVLEGNRTAAVAGYGDETELELNDLSMVATQARVADLALGSGLTLGDGAHARLERAVLEENRDVGLWAFGEGTELVLVDAVVRETLSREADGLYGVGLEASHGALVEVTRALFDQNVETGVWALDDGTVLHLTDVIVRDTREREQGGQYGQGLVVQDGARAVVSRAFFEGNSASGVSGLGDGTRLIMTDLVIRVTRGQESDGRFGTGLLVSEGARADVIRALLERNTTEGVRATRYGTTLNLSDVTIRNTRSQQIDGLFGIGLVAGGEAEVDLQRAVMEGNRYAGAVAFGRGTSLTASDLVVRETEGQERDGLGGRGIETSSGARAEARRAVLEGNRDVGAMAFGAGTTLALIDAVVRDTHARSGESEGTGLASLGGASLFASRLLVSDSTLCGVMLAKGRDPSTGQELPDMGGMSASEVEVSSNPVGLNVQSEDFDVTSLIEQILFRTNDVDIDRGDLPVPDLTPSLSSD